MRKNIKFNTKAYTLLTCKDWIRERQYAWMMEGVKRNTHVVHIFNNLLLGSCSGQLRLRPARTRGPPFVNYIIHKNNGIYKCREKC